MTQQQNLRRNMLHASNSAPSPKETVGPLKNLLCQLRSQGILRLSFSLEYVTDVINVPI